MPQLDITSYFSQAFWLIAVFIMLYITVRHSFLPKVSGIIKQRADQIAFDIAETEKIIEEHKNLKAELQTILNNARTEAFNLRTTTSGEAKAIISYELERLEEKLEKKSETELKRLEIIKSQFKKDLPVVVKELSNEILKIISLTISDKQNSSIH